MKSFARNDLHDRPRIHLPIIQVHCCCPLLPMLCRFVFVHDVGSQGDHQDLLCVISYTKHTREFELTPETTSCDLYMTQQGIFQMISIQRLTDKHVFHLLVPM